MSISVSRTISHSLSTLAVAVLSATSLTAAAQELQPQSPPNGLYGGVIAGLGVNKWECGAGCDRTVMSGKLFGGKRLTPSMAMEINYLVFGGMNRSYDNAGALATGISAERRHTRVLTVGAMKEFPLLENFTTQMRIGWAYVRQNRSLTLRGAASPVDQHDHTNTLYLGLGMGFEVVPDVKLVSSLDYVVNGRNSNFLLGVGAMAEF